MHPRLSHFFVAAMAGVAFLIDARSTSATPEAASMWSEAHGARARLVAGGAGLAGVEIELQPGWKTYWRSPGDAGGVPPSFDWSGSTNAADVEVLYPAPHRISGKDGDSVGYKDHVLFPVRLRLPDPGKPASLKLTLFFGICKDICVPVEAKFALDVPAEKTPETAAALAGALDLVPRGDEARRPGDPVLTETRFALDGKPVMWITGRFSGQPAAADLFLEAPDGLFLPLPTKVKTNGEETVFEVETSGLDVTGHKKKTITATLVGSEGASTATFTVP